MELALAGGTELEAIAIRLEAIATRVGRRPLLPGLEAIAAIATRVGRRPLLLGLEAAARVGGHRY